MQVGKLSEILPTTLNLQNHPPRQKSVNSLSRLLVGHPVGPDKRASGQVSTAKRIAPLRSRIGRRLIQHELRHQPRTGRHGPHAPLARLRRPPDRQRRGGAPVGVRAAAPFENCAGATWPDAAPLLRHVFYYSPKRPKPHLLPPPPPPYKTTTAPPLPLASIRSAQIQPKSLLATPCAG